MTVACSLTETREKVAEGSVGPDYSERVQWSQGRSGEEMEGSGDHELRPSSHDICSHLDFPYKTVFKAERSRSIRSCL